MRKSCCSTTSENRWRLLLLLVLALLTAGCTNLFFFPTRQQVYTPATFNIASRDVSLVSADGTKLFAWELLAEKPRGIVCFFHGNGENISTHFINTIWMPAAGYNVLLPDYRGYGASAGKATFPEVLDDVRAGLDWCVARGHELGVPAFAMGQSLGGALVLEVTSKAPYNTTLAGIIDDSGFSSYRGVARDVMRGSLLLRPLRWPLSMLVTGSHDPLGMMPARGSLPLLVMHSRADQIVPYAHSEKIFAAASAPKCFLETKGPHTAALHPRFPGSEVFQQAVKSFLDSASGGGFACGAPLLDHLPDQHANLE